MKSYDDLQDEAVSRPKKTKAPIVTKAKHATEKTKRGRGEEETKASTQRKKSKVASSGKATASKGDGEVVAGGGFNKKMMLSAQLAGFLGVEEESRPQVGK